jgi:hypothetical protein
MAGSRKPHVEVHFGPLKPGLESITTTHSARGGQGGGPSWDHAEEKQFHPTMAHAVKHLKSTMGHCFANAPEKEDVSEAESGEEE